MRNFVTEGQQPPAAPRNESRWKRRDYLVNKVDLDSSILTQRPVSTEFALVNMYRDPGFIDNPYHLEQKLSCLETQASQVFQRACNVFARGSVLELSRLEVDQLRKFLFLMKYRNSGMFDRYNHDHVDNYVADDRERMLAYMDSKGFKKPRDVWFDNLRQFLDLEMDPEKSWMGTIKTRMYPDDAIMFERHLTCSFITFCEPTSSEDEFLLTQNAFCIYEGPSSMTRDLLTGKVECVAYTEYHNFAPITPRLIIILRSHLLSPPAQDGACRRAWDLLTTAERSQHLNPDRAESILQDLPVRPCETAYVRQKINHASSFHRNDRFRFQCFKLTSAHITTINSLLLEEAYTTSSIVYRSPTSLKSSLKNYLQDETDGMKSILNGPLDTRRLYLVTLEKIVRDLGGIAQCKTRNLGLTPSRIHMALYVAGEVAIQLLQSEEKERSLPVVYSLLKPGTLAIVRRYVPDINF